ncbi:MAG TPA: flavin reductase [Cytophagales bacterium]|nr:flavin reductase [Cytophagales bacterium]HAP60682.1 flavin reductase [Cytophagales bacterium]
MITIDPKDVPVPTLHGYLLGTIAPRPIAFASTIDAQGQINLSPFSFFNVFGANPPTLIFSPARRVRDNTTKHTLANVEEVPEVVVNIVDYPMVEQMSLASSEYPQGVNEFEKAGLAEEASERVRPPRVAEAPAAFECKITQVVPLGEEGGAGNLIICEVVLAHFQEHIFGQDGKVDPTKLDAVARMGGDWYCRAQGSSLFTLPKPNRIPGMGIDQLPDSIRNSAVLTGNQLARLANQTTLPEQEAISQYGETETAKELYLRFGHHLDSFEFHTHEKAAQLLTQNKVEEAWLVLSLPSPKE